MKKKKQRLLLVVWLSVAAVSRILYFFLAQGTALDTYLYGANAVRRAGGGLPVLSSGLAYAYTERLSAWFLLAGENKMAVMALQTVLQILWLYFTFFGVRLLWGKFSGYIVGTLLMASPYLLFSLKIVEPLNFYMFHWSLLLFLFGVFRSQTQKRGWYRNNAGELFLILTGFYLGVVCTWNYLGFLLFFVMLYVLVSNHTVLREKLWKQKNLQLEEKEQLMPVGSQGFILLLGTAVGMFATLMKYTGLTGMVLVEQFFNWLEQLEAFPGRCQDVSTVMLIWLVLILAAGSLGQVFSGYLKTRAEEKREYQEYVRNEKERKEMQEGYFTAADGREVKYIDNPLPGPRKHVKKEMDFKLKEIKEPFTEAKKDDFDYEIDEGNDFDYY